jgi:hypothetical protein
LASDTPSSIPDDQPRLRNTKKLFARRNPLKSHRFHIIIGESAFGIEPAFLFHDTKKPR